MIFLMGVLALAWFW